MPLIESGKKKKYLSGMCFSGFADSLLRAFEILEDAYQCFFEVGCCSTLYETEVALFSSSPSYIKPITRALYFFY